MTNLESKIFQCKDDIRILQESLKQIEKELEESRWAPPIDVGDRYRDNYGIVRMYTEDKKWIFVNTGAGCYSGWSTEKVLERSFKLFDIEILP